MLTKKIANSLGVCSTVTIALFWILLWNVPRWHAKGWYAKLPGEVATKTIILAALAASIFASLKGSRLWLITVIIAVVTAGILLTAPV